MQTFIIEPISILQTPRAATPLKDNLRPVGEGSKFRGWYSLPEVSLQIVCGAVSGGVLKGSGLEFRAWEV